MGPPGLSAAPSGPGLSETFTVKASDANGVADTQVLTLTVNAAPTVATTTLPGATKTGTYYQTLAVSRRNCTVHVDDHHWDPSIRAHAQ